MLLTLVNVLKDRDTRLKSKLEYFRFVSGEMSEKEGDEYIQNMLTVGGDGVHKGMLGDIRDYGNVTIIKHNIENSEQWITEIDGIIIWINRGKSMMPTDEERKNDNFFDLEIKHEMIPRVELEETVDIEVNMKYLKIAKVTEYLSTKIPEGFVVNYNKIYIAESCFNDVAGFINTFKNKKFIKSI